MLLKLRTIARRILGRRGTFMLRNTLATILAPLLPCSDDYGKEKGITAIMITYNDPDWIEPAILSIKDVVNEYVVVDSSTDETPQIIERIREEHGLSIKLYRMHPGNLSETRNFALKHTNYKWVLIWDSDFVANDNIKLLREIIETIDRCSHYLIYFPLILLCVDFKHLCPNIYHVEHWLYTWSPKLRYARIGVHDSLIAPAYMYKAMYIDKPLGFHITFRHPYRIAVKRLAWKKPWTDEYLAKGLTYEDIAKIKAKELYGTDKLECIGMRFLMNELKQCPEYDESKYGPLPSILKPYIKRYEKLLKELADECKDYLCSEST